MTRTFFPRMPAVAVLCAAAAVVVSSSCGGDSGNSMAPNPSATSARPPTPTPTPGGVFTGNFAATVALDAGRSSAVSLTVQSDEQASGTLIVTGGTTTETVPLSGFVALSNGDFSLSGSSSDASIVATVSGTLPAPGGGSGIVVIQIGTNFFRGSISTA
ncbi:MAG TPA: hypothetical protein VMW56_24715 [Candidatus Margulisiibacteriota bacterium]|nr:hypothetical protein [Candidatus Margulisiibacteriota bacterium]